MIRPIFVAALTLFTTFSCFAAELPHGEVGPGVPPFWVRPGYKVTLVASGLTEARFLEFGEGETLFVSQPNHGKVVMLRNPDANGMYKSVTALVSNYEKVQGLQWYKGWLWFTPSGSVHKVQIKPDGMAGDVVDIDCGELPEGGGHWYRPILVDDDGFYTAIGDDGNMNDHSSPTDDREKIWHYNLDGSGKKLFCSGIRNTEKLLYRPGTREVWGCDHGSDNFGAKFGETKGNQPVTDLNPPDKFFHYVEGGFYGHPFIVGNHLPRYEFMNRPDILELAAKTIAPAWDNGAHWANCGWTFLKQDKLTGQIGDAVVAFHGSWNSTKKVGYCLQRLEFDAVTGLPCGSTTLVSTLGSDGETVLDRPVDCTEAPDGSLLFTSDTSKRIYRITRIGGK